jgi:Protein of unknown function (DUF3892)
MSLTSFATRAAQDHIQEEPRMSKWADYVITGVKYSVAGLHIDRVQVREDNGDSLGHPKEMTRAEVVKLIEQRKTFVTATASKTEKGKWTKGALVSIFPVETRFLKTVADKRESDNLENLATF